MKTAGILQRKFMFLPSLIAMGFTSHAFAAWTMGEWYINPDNGHAYSVQAITGSDLSWSAARSQAQALSYSGATVDLATITSAAENAFVFAGINDPAYMFQNYPSVNYTGPWLGGYQLNDDDGYAANWAWVTGETWDYTSWQTGQPDNVGFHPFATVGGADYLAYKDEPTWHDMASFPENAWNPRYYIAETIAVVPEPSVSLLGLAGVAGLLVRRRRAA